MAHRRPGAGRIIRNITEGACLWFLLRKDGSGPL
jgi:hypothetical protein